MSNEDPLSIIGKRCDEILSSERNCSSLASLLPNCLTRRIAWKPPYLNFVKLNTDEVCKLPTYIAGAGGVL